MAKALGLDVSKYQDQELDWTRIKNAGYSFVYIRYGHGDGTDGSGKDPWFDRHYAGAKQAGLSIGIYWYMWSINIPEQVKLFTQIDHAKFDLPAALDVEQTNISEPNLKLFLQELERITGRVPVIYTRKDIIHTIVGTGKKTWLAHYPLWIAQYPPAPVGDYPTLLPDSWTNYLIWQWTSEGGIPGYIKPVDVNYWNGSVDDLCCRFRIPKPTEFPMRWPVISPVVTQPFGENPSHYGPLLGAPGMGHEGVDFRANLNDPIYACAEGIVAEKYFDQDYGNLVVLDHQNGFKTLYGHMSRLSSLAIGTRVRAGDRIGDAGTTGASTGVHLHLTLYYADGEGVSVYPKKTRGYIINPTPYLQAPTQAPVAMRMIYTQDINIRADATINSLDIGDVVVGEIVAAYPPAVNEYLRITAHGITGYALAKHFEIVVDQTITLRSTATPYVNIRSGPSTGFSIVGTLAFGAEITGYPTQENGFYKVIYNGATAYISAAWLVVV